MYISPVIKEKIPCVTRDTRNFNTQLCSAGVSDSREALLLLPKSETLQAEYATLKGKLDQFKKKPKHSWVIRGNLETYPKSSS